MLSRNTIREPLPPSRSIAMVKLAPSVPGFHRTEHTFRVNVRGQVHAHAKRPHGNIGRDPKNCCPLGRFVRFLRLFEQRHLEARQADDRRLDISKFGKKFPAIVVPTIRRRPSRPVFCDYEAEARLPITYNISGHRALIMGFRNLLSISQRDRQRIAGSTWEGETTT